MNVAVIFAGGVGSRACTNGSSTPKQFLVFHEKPILIHTLEHFERHPDIDAVSLAMVGEWLDHTRALLKEFGITKVRWIVEGGETGQDSIRNALDAIETEDDTDTVVLVHDGVRPLIDESMITHNIECARTHGTAITAYPTFETSVVSWEGESIDEVLERSVTYVAQAPQSFNLSLLRKSHQRALEDERHDFIDSCSLVRTYNDTPMHMVMGSRTNIKITTPEDFLIFEALYNAERA
jgi:2-C-methyl-D-erythritol 4-phosphate cytidylyltransferase